MCKFKTSNISNLFVKIYLKKFTNNKRLIFKDYKIRRGYQHLMFLKSPKHFKVGKHVVKKTQSQFYYQDNYNVFFKFNTLIAASNSTLYLMLNNYIKRQVIYGALITKYHISFNITIKF